MSPVLNEYGLTFRVMHGWSSATAIHNIVEEANADGRWLTVLYVGDFDPSGMYMSAMDLPKRLVEYGSTGIMLERVALLEDDLRSLPTFKAKDKKKDPRYEWFREQHGTKCCEIDALPPNELRQRLCDAVRWRLDIEKWERSLLAEQAEQASLRGVLDSWNDAFRDKIKNTPATRVPVPAS